jgi:antitoxin (DNA-binding transcriptional repressor) of toxin-antitoxin stability system
MRIKYLYSYLFSFLVLLLILTGCEGDSHSGNSPKIEGYIIDSPVENLKYSCGDIEGVTDSQGTFQCSSLPVTFYIGNLEVGTLSKITSDSKVYPQDLVGIKRDNFSNENLIKLLRLLQSLDTDGDINKTITLPLNISTPKKMLSEMTIEDIEVLLKGLGKILISQEDAIRHLKEQMNMDITKPVIKLNGVNPQTILQGTEYIEAGATATDDRDGTVTVDISGTVDITKVGTYTITYKAKDKAGNEAVITRTVKVVEKIVPDTTKPIITLNGTNPQTITKGSKYNELGATAIDDRDGTVNVDISGTVDINKIGTYTVTYKAKDKAGNEAVVTRTVKVVEKIVPDRTKPIITLNGANPQTITKGSKYNELGATAIDDRDGTV